jgi:2-amino-4-hydroxy-6-hydroxymethyldihydropteridine diphosphokinase
MDYVVGLGANLGSRENQLQAALERLVGTRVARVVATSHVFESAPVGPPQPRYLNAAARLQSELDPHALLRELLEVERMLGRERRERWGARTLDLDILWAARSVDSEALRVPHPRLHERWFARIPLLEVAPELVAEYGPAPAAGEEAGGALRYEDGARRLGRLALAPRARTQRDGAMLSVHGEGLDALDALAAACSAVGRELWPELADESQAGAFESELVHVAASDPHAALLAALDQRARRGHAFARVVITAHGGGAFEARVLGAAGHARTRALSRATLRSAADAGRDRVQIVLHDVNGSRVDGH